MTIVQSPNSDGSELLPQEGAAPGVPSILAGLPGQQQPAPMAGALEQMVAGYLKHITTVADQSTVVQKAKAQAAASQAAADKPVTTNAADANAPAGSAPAPGSFGDKLQGALSNVSGALGDVAHANDVRGGGFLGGFVNTTAARNERLAREKKDQALMAKTQAETVMMHRNMYLQDLPVRQASYKGNQEYVDTMKVNHDIEEGLTHDELVKRSKEKGFAEKYYVRATGEEPVLGADGLPQKDKEGIPVTSPQYTLVARATKDGKPDDHTVTGDMSADMKKYLGTALPPNTKLTTDQFTALNTSLNNARNAVNTLEAGNDGKQLSEGQMKSISPYLNDPTIQSAIAHVPGSPYAGLLEYQKNASDQIDAFQMVADKAKQQKDQATYDRATTMISQIKEEQGKVASFMASGAIDAKQIAAYDKKNEEQIGWVDKVLHDPSALSGDKASSVLPQLEGALANTTDPALKAKLTTAISTAKQARDNYFEDIKRKATADQLAKQGSPQAAGRALASGDVTLADLKTRQTTADFILQSIDEAKKIDAGYNPADEVNFEHQAKSASAAQFFGSARSLMEKAGTADQLYNIGKRIPDNSMPALNKLEDWVDLSRGKGPLAGYASLVLGVADDYAKVMGGGAASDTARNYALQLFAAAQNQQQRLEAIQGLLGGVGSQFHGRVGNNKFFQREYDNFERSALTPAVQAAAAPPVGQGQPTISQQNTQAGHKVGQKFTSNGHEYTVTSVDAKGNVTGAE